MTLKKLPIGYDDFGQILSMEFDIVDKTLFIKDVLDDVAQVIVLTRPRRFGKTLNLSMLRYFLTNDVSGMPTKGLFDPYLISQQGETYMQHQGQFPVIALTFKDVKAETYEEAYAQIEELMRALYSEFIFLLESSALHTSDKTIFNTILDLTASPTTICKALKNLARYLCLHCGVKPWILIDEYDTPLQKAFLGDGYEKMMDCMRNLLGATLKNNEYLYRSVITGILYNLNPLFDRILETFLYLEDSNILER